MTSQNFQYILAFILYIYTYYVFVATIFMGWWRARGPVIHRIPSPWIGHW